MASFGDLNRVNTNVQSLDSQLSLNRVNRDLANSRMRMSTGLKINRAEDNAAGYSIATKLRSRTAGLEQALQNVGDAKSVLDIAESSFDTIMDSLVEMKGLATQAANDTLGDTERGYIGEQIAALGEDINEIANQTVYQDFQLLNGDNNTYEGSLGLTFQVGERASDTISADLEAVNVNELFAGSAAAYQVTNATVGVTGTDIGGTASDTVTDITVQDSSGATVGTVSGLTIDTSTVDATSLGEVADAINDLGVEGLTAAANGANDGLVITNSSTSESYDITFDGNGSANGSGSDTTVANGTISTNANVAGQGEMQLTGWSSDDFRSFIADIDTATNRMSDRVNSIGIAQSSLSVREETLSESISSNESARSRIMDTDFAKEQSNSVKLQILQQTATSSLAQANMGPQSVLGFLG